MNEADILQTIAIIVTIFALILSHYFYWKSVNAQSFSRIGDTYDKIVEYRLQHPEVLAIAKQWKKGDLNKIDSDSEIAKYYSYGELCIGFCDNCLYHQRSKLMSKKTFNDYYSGLMNLVAEENRYYFDEIVKKPYCSKAFKEWFRSWIRNA